MLDIHAIRKDFPILQDLINGYPLIYLDNAATTQKPKPVLDAMQTFYSHGYANIHRGIHTLSDKASLQYEQARKAVQHFIHAKMAKECIFVKGTTEAINLIAHSFVRPLMRPGAAILITEMEHHANLVPWQVIAQTTGCELRVWPVQANGELNLDDLLRLVTPDVKFMSITHVSNVLGTINPIKRIIEIAHNYHIPVLVDGAQAVAHMAIDVQDLDADFYAFSGHKIYGPTGIGVLYGKAKWLENMVPYQTGGGMVSLVSWEKTLYQAIPNRFEAGTPPIADAIGLHAALDYLASIGWEAIRTYEKTLFDYAHHALSTYPEIQIIGQATSKTNIFSFLMPAAHAHDIGTLLNHFGIAIRSGHHCAMPLMTKFKIPATTRASLCFYNTCAEIDALIHALDQVKKVFHHD